MTIMNKIGIIQYYISEEEPPVNLMMVPSEFKATSVTCVNCTNGAITDFQFFLTLEVSTPAGSYMNVSLPPDIIINQSEDVHCVGLLLLEKSISCSFDGLDTI